MTILESFSRRDALRLMLNMGVLTFGSTGLISPRQSQAQEHDNAFVLGHFGSANPQVLGKAMGSYKNAFGSGIKTEFVTVSAGSQVLAAIAGTVWIFVM